MCHIVSRGCGRQSWIEDKKRIRSVTSCADPGFSRLKLCGAALGLRRASVSIYPPKSTQMSSFSSSSQQQFLTELLFFPRSFLFNPQPVFQPHVIFPSSIKRLTIPEAAGCTGVNTEHLSQGYFDYISVTQLTMCRNSTAALA